MVATPGSDTIGMLGWLTVVTRSTIGVNLPLRAREASEKRFTPV